MSADENASPAQFQHDLVALIPHLRAFSRMLCRRADIADDLVQDTLAKSWAARARFQPGTNLKAWLFTILRHEYYSHGRRALSETSWEEGNVGRIRRSGNSQQ